MPLERFIPKSPDPFIRNSQDFEVAKFGHLNTIIEYVNTYVVTDSLQLAGTGPLTSTARYITDSLGNASSLAISTGNIGIGTSTPAGKFDIVSDGGGQLLFSRYGGQPQINIRRSQGTFAAPTAVTSGASSVLNFQNYDGTSFGTSAQIQSVPTENQTPTAKGASLALNVVQAGTTSVINGLIVSGASTNPGSVSITTNFSAATARLSIWQTALSSTLPYFNIQETGGGELLEFSNAGNLLVGSGSPSDTAKVSIKGSGSTSATTSLLVQNSLGSNALTITDNLNATFGNTVYAGGGFVFAGVSELYLNCRVTTTNGLNPQERLFSAEGSASQTIIQTTSFHDIRNFTPTLGNALYTAFQYSGTINQTGGANGITRGLYINPTLTAAADFRAIEATQGNVLLATTSGRVGIGTTNPFSLLTVGGQSSFYSVQSAGAGADFFYTDINPNLTAGANNQVVSLVRLRDRGVGNTGGFTGTQRLSLIMENAAGGQFPFQLFSDTGALRVGFSSVATPTALVHLQGTGSTSATTSLLVQNSGGNNALKVRDDGKTAFGNSTVDCTITGTAGSGNKFEFYAFNGYDIIDGFGNVLVTGLGDTIRLPRRVGIGFNTQNHASAVLQADSTTQGFLPPRMTTAQRTAIVSPAAGLIVYDTTTNKSYTYDGTAWQAHY